MELYKLKGVAMLATCHESLANIKDLLDRKEVDDIEITFRFKDGQSYRIPSFTFFKLPQNGIVSLMKMGVYDRLEKMETEIKNL